MQLPNAHRAVVDESKVRDYLLSIEHPIGRFKAAFFRALGYSAVNWVVLQHDLLAHGRTGEATPDAPSAHGQKFRVRAMLQGPEGRSAPVGSVWILRTGDDAPRFVTAFPGGAR